MSPQHSFGVRVPPEHVRPVLNHTGQAALAYKIGVFGRCCVNSYIATHNTITVTRASVTMVVIKVSRTAIINPPGASPVLTVDQLWQGMVIKARKPQEFVQLMESCEVLTDDYIGLRGVVTLKNGWGPPGGKAEEEIKYYAPMRVSQLLFR
jgi:hypothetical protein